MGTVPSVPPVPPMDPVRPLEPLSPLREKLGGYAADAAEHLGKIPYAGTAYTIATEAAKVADGRKTAGDAFINGASDIAAGAVCLVPASAAAGVNPVLGVGTYVGCKEAGSSIFSKMGHAVAEKFGAFVEGVRRLPADVRALVEFQLNAQGETLTEWGTRRSIVEDDDE